MAWPRGRREASGPGRVGGATSAGRRGPLGCKWMRRCMAWWRWYPCLLVASSRSEADACHALLR
eukprot:1536881-Pyramimonas_sp.AAC.1